MWYVVISFFLPFHCRFGLLEICHWSNVWYIICFCSWQWPNILRLHFLKGWMVYNLVKSLNSNLGLTFLLCMVCSTYFSRSDSSKRWCWHIKNWCWFSGDNFFKTASYTIEALCAKSFENVTQKLQEIEAQILAKRNDLRQFEIEYKKVRIIWPLYVVNCVASCASGRHSVWTLFSRFNYENT